MQGCVTRWQGQGEWFGLGPLFDGRGVLVTQHREGRAVLAMAQLTVIVCDPNPRMHVDFLLPVKPFCYILEQIKGASLVFSMVPI